MEALGLYSSSRPFFPSSHYPNKTKPRKLLPSPLLTKAMATPKPGTQGPRTTKGSSGVFPVGKPGPRQTNNGAPPVKLLTNVEKLRLLTKAEKAGLLSAAENFGLSLSTVEELGLLSKAEEFGVLSAATDPGTPGTLLSLSLLLLILGPVWVYIVPDDNALEVALQVAVALVCVVGGPATFAASNFVSNLQRSS